MELIVSAALVIGGFFAGTFVFARVGRLITTLYELIKDQNEGGVLSKAGTLVSGALLSSGFWIFILAVVFAYQIFSEPWAVLLVAGFIGAIVTFSLLTIYLARKARRKNAV